MSRKQIRADLLVNSWSPEKNKPYAKRGIKPTITEEGLNNCFSVFLRTYIEDSPKLLGTIAKEIGISMSSLSNYLYKGHNPSYQNLMLIIHHVSLNTNKDPADILAFLFENWSLHNVIK